MRSFMESCWISLTSREIRVENTNALQTTLVEVIHQRCSLMCSVRTNALHHHSFFVLTRLNEVCCLMFFSLIHVLIESSSHNYWCFSCTNKCSGWFVSETIHFLFLIYSLFSKNSIFFLLVHFKNMTPFGLVKYWLMKLNDKLMMVFHENETFFRDNSPKGLLWEKVRDHFSGLFCESVIPLSGKYKSFPGKSWEFQNPIFCGSHVIVYIWW